MNKFIRQLSYFTLVLLTAALISQGAAASSSWVTWGFSVGASAELSGTSSKDSSKSSSSVASNLSGKNIKILTDSNKDTAINIKGSNLYASNDIYLNTHNLFIDASQDSYEAKQSSKTISGRVSATMYGGGGGSAGLDYSKSNMKEESLSHNNAKVYAGHNIYALASNDALIKGANLRADNALALKVGHDLSLHSLRDSYNYDSKSSSIGAGIGISGSKTTSDPSRPYAIGNNIVRYSNSKLSSINANYSRSKSSTMVKQTVLSSITAKELNIEVGSNTDLKGSLIAAGYYDENGNFIDNGKLRLKTDSLTFSNLSNTRYDKSNSLSIGANYAFKDPQQGSESKDGGSQASTAGSNAFSSNQMSGMQTSGTSLQDKKNDTDPKSKISSINYSNNRNLSYAISKSLATIGKGELIVGDKDISSLSKDELASLQSDPNNKALYNSDDLTRLNRDSFKLSKELYSTKLNSSVDTSVDMRLFSEGGRNEIKDDYNRGSAIEKSLEMLIKTGDLSFNENVAEYANAYELSKAYGKDLSSVLMDEKVGINTKEQVIKSLVDAYAKANGLNLEGIKVKLISDANAKGKNDEPFKGNFDSLSKTITLNLANTLDIKTFAQTLGHEISHAIDYKKGRFIPGGEAMNRYADIKGDHFADYLEKGLDITGSKINLGDKLPSYDKYDKINKALLEHNLKNFNGTDKRWSDNADKEDGNIKRFNSILGYISKSEIMVFDPLEGLIDINDPDRIKMLPMGWRPKPVGRAEASKITLPTKEDAIKTGKEGSGFDARVAGVNEAKSIVRIGKEVANKGQSSPNIIEKIIQRGEIKPGDHKVMVSKLDDGTIVTIRKDFGKYSHGFPDHYNIEIRIPYRNTNIRIENLHIFPTEKGYKWYGVDGVIKGE